MKIQHLLKHMKYALLTTCIMLIVLAIVTGCASPSYSPSAPASISPSTASSITPLSTQKLYTDDLGRTVTIKGIPRSIISLAPSNAEILYALGLGDKVVGVTSYDNYPPEAKTKPDIGGFSTPDLEKVVSLSPDLILAAQIHQKEVIPQLEKQGLTVFAVVPKTFNEIFQAINKVGQITGTESAAAQLTSQMDKRTKAITDATAGLSSNDKPRVLYVVWHEPLMAGGSGTIIDDMITKCGGTNIANDLSGYPSISLETVIQRNPQIILVLSSMGDQSTSFNYIKTEARFQATDALKNNQVYKIDTDIFGRTTPRIVDGLEQIAKIIHPELFK